MNYTYFASGATMSVDLLGFADINHPAGITVDIMNKESHAAVLSLAGTGLKIFIDSGAFSEVKVNEKGKIEVVRPIDEAEWRRRIGVYRGLAKRLKSQLYVVAPDRVGSQKETMQRLARHLDELREVSEDGANILVPLHLGEMTQTQMHHTVSRMMEGMNWMPALPCKKAATSAEEILEYCGTVKPSRVHLLGAGPKSDVVAQVLDTICTQTDVYMDSCCLRSNSGWTNGRGGGPRVLTIAKALTNAAGYQLGEARRLSISMTFQQSTELMWRYQTGAVKCPDGSVVDSPYCSLGLSRYFASVVDDANAIEEYLGYPPTGNLYVSLWDLDTAELLGLAEFDAEHPFTLHLGFDVPEVVEFWFLAQCFRQVQFKLPHRRVALIIAPKINKVIRHQKSWSAIEPCEVESASDPAPCLESSIQPSL
jgi:hypothetical protein|tara:strand:- start:844 stop:2112 length:1269 start_codon:yes stop_codon:yes gene_type:complete